MEDVSETPTRRCHHASVCDAPADRPRQFDRVSEDRPVAVAETLAGHDDVAVTDLSTMGACIDRMLDHLSSRPPAADEQMEVGFRDSDYRLAVEQAWNVTCVTTG